jgi:hypothetical protein
MKRFPWLSLLLTLGLVGTDSARAEFVLVEAAYPDSTPLAGSWWYATSIGWEHTASRTYDLSRVETKFGHELWVAKEYDPGGYSRTVTLEVYDGVPYAGGQLLRSTTFTPLANEFSGGSFAPLTLVAGKTYFIGFQNVGGLSVNMAGYENLRTFHFGVDPSIPYVFTAEPGGWKPILKFYTGDPPLASAPEPGSLTLLATGVLGLAGVVWRRRSRLTSHVRSPPSLAGPS